jgi:hypothetical protein
MFSENPNYSTGECLILCWGSLLTDAPPGEKPQLNLTVTDRPLATQKNIIDQAGKAQVQESQNQASNDGDNDDHPG